MRRSGIRSDALGEGEEIGLGVVVAMIADVVMAVALLVVWASEVAEAVRAARTGWLLRKQTQIKSPCRHMVPSN